MNYIKKLKDLRLKDIPLVGGKNASLGQMIADLTDKNIRVPGGFAVTAQGYQKHLEENKFKPLLKAVLKPVKKGVRYRCCKKRAKKHVN